MVDVCCGLLFLCSGKKEVYLRFQGYRDFFDWLESWKVQKECWWGGVTSAVLWFAQCS